MAARLCKRCRNARWRSSEAKLNRAVEPRCPLLVRVLKGEPEHRPESAVWLEFFALSRAAGCKPAGHTDWKSMFRYLKLFT